MEELERQLKANEKKARKDRLSLLRIHEDLVSLGYKGGYDAVRRYARAWRRRWRLLSAVAVAMSAPWSMMGVGVGSAQPMSDTTVTGRPGPGSHQVTMSVEVGTSTGCPRVADMSGE